MNSEEYANALHLGELRENLLHMHIANDEIARPGGFHLNQSKSDDDGNDLHCSSV